MNRQTIYAAAAGWMLTGLVLVEGAAPGAGLDLSRERASLQLPFNAKVLQTAQPGKEDKMWDLAGRIPGAPEQAFVRFKALFGRRSWVFDRRIEAAVKDASMKIILYEFKKKHLVLRLMISRKGRGDSRFGIKVEDAHNRKE